jgi:hypothetical protein
MSLTVNLRESEILARFIKCRALEVLKDDSSECHLIQVRIFMSDDGPRIAAFLMSVHRPEF